MKTFLQWLEAKVPKESRKCPDCGQSFIPKGFRYCPTCVKARKVVMNGSGYLERIPKSGARYRGPESQEDTYATKYGVNR